MNKSSFKLTTPLLRQFCRKTGLPLAINGLPQPFLCAEKQQNEMQKLVEASVAHTLEKLQIPHIDPSTNQLATSNIFSKIDAIVTNFDPDSKIYIYGGVVRSVLSFIYWYLINEHQKNPGNIQTKQILEEFLSKNASYHFQHVLGLGSDLDLLLDQKDSLEKIDSVTREVKKFIDQYQNTLPAKLQNFLSLYGDVKNYNYQVPRCSIQGGSPIDWLSFPITPRSGNSFREPENHPGIVKNLLQGRFTFYSVEKSEARSDTVARVMRTLLDLPFAQPDPDCIELLCNEIQKLPQEPDSKVLKTFRKAVLNARYYPGYSHPINYIAKTGTDLLSLSLREHSKRHVINKNLPLIPELLESQNISERNLDFDPGDLKKDNLLTPISEFTEIHTDNGYLYHGTFDLLSLPSMFRGTYFVSNDSQGCAGFGKGFYSSKNSSIALSYAESNSLNILKFNISKSPKIRILEIKKIPTEKLNNWREQAKQSNQDLHTFLFEKLSVDIIVNEHVLIQNMNVIKLPTTIEEMHSDWIDSSICRLERKIQNNESIHYEEINPLIELIETQGICSLIQLKERNSRIKNIIIASIHNDGNFELLTITKNLFKNDERLQAELQNIAESLIQQIASNSSLNNSDNSPENKLLSLLSMKDFWFFSENPNSKQLDIVNALKGFILSGKLVFLNDSTFTWFENDPEVMLKAIENNLDNITKIGSSLKNNPLFTAQIIQLIENVLKKLNTESNETLKLELLQKICKSFDFCKKEIPFFYDHEKISSLKNPIRAFFLQLKGRNDYYINIAILDLFKITSQWFTADAQIILHLAKKIDRNYLTYADESLKDNIEFAEQAIKINPSIIFKLNTNILKNKQLLIKALHAMKDISATDLKSILTHYENDLDIATILIKMNPDHFSLLNPALRENLTLALLALNNWEDDSHKSKTFQNSKDNALKSFPLQFMSETLKQNEEIICLSVKKIGWENTLKIANSFTTSNKELLNQIAKTHNNSWNKALKYASKELTKDKDFFISLSNEINFLPELYSFMDKSLRTDASLFLEIIDLRDQGGRYPKFYMQDLELIPDSLKNNQQLILKMIKGLNSYDRQSFDFVKKPSLSPELLSNKDFIQQLVTIYPTIAISPALHPSLKNDKDILLQALQKAPNFTEILNHSRLLDSVPPLLKDKTFILEVLSSKKDFYFPYLQGLENLYIKDLNFALEIAKIVPEDVVFNLFLTLCKNVPNFPQHPLAKEFLKICGGILNLVDLELLKDKTIVISSLKKLISNFKKTIKSGNYYYINNIQANDRSFFDESTANRSFKESLEFIHNTFADDLEVQSVLNDLCLEVLPHTKFAQDRKKAIL